MASSTRLPDVEEQQRGPIDEAAVPPSSSTYTEEEVEGVGDSPSHFLVGSKHMVDTLRGVCTCAVGERGELCVHMHAVFTFYPLTRACVLLPGAFSGVQRARFLKMAGGPVSFYDWPRALGIPMPRLSFHSADDMLERDRARLFGVLYKDGVAVCGRAPSRHFRFQLFGLHVRDGKDKSEEEAEGGEQEAGEETREKEVGAMEVEGEGAEGPDVGGEGGETTLLATPSQCTSPPLPSLSSEARVDAQLVRGWRDALEQATPQSKRTIRRQIRFSHSEKKKAAGAVTGIAGWKQRGRHVIAFFKGWVKAVVGTVGNTMNRPGAAPPKPVVGTRRARAIVDGGEEGQGEGEAPGAKTRRLMSPSSCVISMNASKTGSFTKDRKENKK